MVFLHQLGNEIFNTNQDAHRELAVLKEQENFKERKLKEKEVTSF